MAKLDYRIIIWRNGNIIDWFTDSMRDYDKFHEFMKDKKIIREYNEFPMNSFYRNIVIE